MVSGPLRGVRILDLTHVWAGPLAVRFLADLGADVIKVEAPTGRGPRAFPSVPIGGWLGGEPGDDPWNRNAVFNKLARNRRSLCIDLKQADGRDLFLELVSMADIVVENFSAQAMNSLGLGYDALREANPRIIYLTMPGFGSTGPLSDRVAFGPTVEAMSGFTSMMGYSAEEPRNTAMALMDPVNATHATAALMTALQRRTATGQGCRLEMSLHEGGVNLCGPWLVDLQMGQRSVCVGNRHPEMAPHGVYPCKDDDTWIAIACADEAQWRALCTVIEALDAQQNLTARIADHDAIDGVISTWTRQHSKTLATERLQAAGVAAGAANTVPDMVDDPQVRHRGFFVPYEMFGTPMPGNPIKMPGLDPKEWTPCPPLGADNAEVLADWLDYTDAEIARFTKNRTLADEPPA